MPPKRRSSPINDLPINKSRPGEERHEKSDNEMGEFEDNYEDEFESDGEVIDNANEDDDGVEVMQEENEGEAEAEAAKAKPYIPHQYKLKPDEILEPDNSVYEMLHSMSVPWPCLSFDIMRDGLGDERRSYPEEMFVATGTQAAGDANEVMVMRWANLWKTQQSEDSDDEDDDDNADEQPTIEHKSIPHRGGINRFRLEKFPATVNPTSPNSFPDRPYLGATWADTGKVHIFNLRPHMLSLSNPGFMIDKNKHNKPLFTINSHGSEEGFALDWSTPKNETDDLRLLTGDCGGNIHLSQFTNSGYVPSSGAFTSHTSSVEDLQWSPSEATVFASCSADRTVRIWDTRVRNKKSVVNVMDAHDEDVNVINWNKQTEYLLASGGDEGNVKVWDLRNFKPNMTSRPDPVANFDWHKGAITAIEWHATEQSVLAASGADDQVTLWDLAVELDQEELAQHEIESQVPPQLMFCHQGQKDIKEVHWHSQIPGCFVTTASDGFNVCKTISI
ncbi:WD40 repeat-like protein [Wallemia mellicola]|nr:WD40 repeat-like protein [Wallemia mellicola]